MSHSRDNYLCCGVLAGCNRCFIRLFYPLSFEVPYEFELAENITIPDNCVLEFNGGSITGDGENKNIINIQTGLVLDGIFNDVQFVSSGGSGYITFKHCKFNITTDIVALLLTGQAEKTNIVSECEFNGVFGAAELVGQAIKLSNCLNTTIEKCYFYCLDKAVTLVNEVDHLYFRNNHFLRNLRDIYTEDGLTHQKAHICITDNHFQMGPNGWKSIEMAANSLFIERNEIQASNRTDATYINIISGSNITIRYLSAEMSGSSDFSNIHCIKIAAVDAGYIDAIKADGQFDSIVNVYDTIFGLRIGILSNSPIGGGSANTYIKNAMSSAVALSNRLLLSKPYSINSMNGVCIDYGYNLLRKSIYITNASSETVDLSSYFDKGIKSIKIIYSGVNFSNIGEVDLRVDYDSSGTLVNNNLAYSFDSTTKILTLTNIAASGAVHVGCNFLVNT